MGIDLSKVPADQQPPKKKGGLLTSERKRLHEFEELNQLLQHGQDAIDARREEI
jgi:hypothetical protein